MNKRRIILVVVIALICSWSCASASEETEWPANAWENIYIPPSAKEIGYRSSDGLFMVYYRADICYPAKSMIREIVAMMRSRGWNRMAYDPLNPSDELPRDYPDNDWSWGGSSWKSYWTNRSGNAISYSIIYDIDNKLSPQEYSEALKRSCSLRGVAVYFLPGTLQKMIKDADGMRERRERPQGR